MSTFCLKSDVCVGMCRSESPLSQGIPLEIVALVVLVFWSHVSSTVDVHDIPNGAEVKQSNYGVVSVVLGAVSLSLNSSAFGSASVGGDLHAYLVHTCCPAPY